MLNWLTGTRRRDERRRKIGQKSYPGDHLIALSGGSSAIWTERSPLALAREGMERNPIVYRAVRMVAEAAASVPLVLREGEREHKHHPLLDLLRRPNPRQAGPELFEAALSHLMIAGDAYLECVFVAGEPVELHVLRSDQMQLVTGPDGWPVAYEHRAGGRVRRFDQSGLPPPILHLSLFSPTDDHRGAGPLAAAQMALDVHNAANAWNKALIDNAARPSGALVYSAGDGALSESQFDRLKRELEETFQGALNAGRPLLLEGGLDWKPLSLSPRDMDFNELKNGAAREIALAFGVPPMLLGIPGDNTYSNYQEANRALWRQTILPLLNRTVACLSHWLSRPFGDVMIDFDRDAIPALSAERDGLWARVKDADFLTVNEKRIATGYGAVAGGDAAPDALSDGKGH
ncbi:MAG: phage portal protein [Pseudomonadota bacterium]